MEKTVLYIILCVFIAQLSFAGNSNKEQPDENLVFSHDNYKLENFSFISKDFSVGLVNPKFQNRTLVILYNNENLIVDSIFTDWQIEKIIPADDSSFFLLSDNQTLNCIIRNDEILINGIYAGNNSTKGYEKLAYYAFPLPEGEFQILKKEKSKREFALQVSNVSPESTIYPFDQKKKNIDIELFATQTNIYIYLPSDQKLVQMNKTECKFAEIDLYESKGNWLFYHDFLKNKSYLLNTSRSTQKLYALNGNSELMFIKDLDFVPEAIFNGSIHKKSDKGKNYSHYLIPLEDKDKEKTIHLKSVTISSE